MTAGLPALLIALAYGTIPLAVVLTHSLVALAVVLANGTVALAVVLTHILISLAIVLTNGAVTHPVILTGALIRLPELLPSVPVLNTVVIYYHTVAVHDCYGGGAYGAVNYTGGSHSTGVSHYIPGVIAYVVRMVYMPGYWAPWVPPYRAGYPGPGGGPDHVGRCIHKAYAGP